MLSEIVLSVVILALIIERFLYSKEMNKQVRELSKLVKSKDASEYAVAQKIEKEQTPIKQVEEEFVPTESLSDEKFFDAIKKQNA